LRGGVEVEDALVEVAVRVDVEVFSSMSSLSLIEVEVLTEVEDTLVWLDVRDVVEVESSFSLVEVEVRTEGEDALVEVVGLGLEVELDVRTEVEVSLIVVEATIELVSWLVIVEEDDEVEGSIGIVVVKVLTDVLIVWIEVEDRVVEELVVGVTVADGTRADETELVEDTGVETDDIELDDDEVVGLELEDVDTMLVDDELLVLVARMLDVELETTTEETLDVWLEAVVLVCWVGNVIIIVVVVHVVGFSVGTLLVLDKLELLGDVDVPEEAPVLGGEVEERVDVSADEGEVEETIVEMEVGLLTDYSVLDWDGLVVAVGFQLVVTLVVWLVFVMTEEELVLSISVNVIGIELVIGLVVELVFVMAEELDLDLVHSISVDFGLATKSEIQ
jgi:hypothetical protein